MEPLEKIPFTRKLLQNHIIYVFFVIFTLTFGKLQAQGCQASAGFTYTQNCSQGMVVFTNTSTCTSGNIVAYYWNFGDGNTSIQKNPIHTYITGYFYTVTLTVTHISGCADTVSATLYVKPLPTAAFSYIPSTMCAETPVNFTDASTGAALSYQWDFGDGTSSALQHPVHQFLSAVGIFTVMDTVTLTVTDNLGCTSSSQSVLSVTPRPAVILYDPDNFIKCVASINSLPVTQGIYNFSLYPWSITSYAVNWGNGSGLQTVNSTFNSTTPLTHNYQAMGFYPFTLIATGTNGCITTINETITVQGNPEAEFFADTTCFGSPTQFIDSTIVPGGIPLTWSWDFGDGSGNSVLQNPAYTYNSPGIYQVVLTVESSIGCSDTVAHQVVITAPVADFNASTTCFGDTMYFTDLSLSPYSPLTSWQWNFGDGSACSNQQQPLHYYANPGVYLVTLVVTNSNNCTAQISKNIEVISPQADFTFISGCPGSPVQFIDLTVSSGGPVIAWSWNFGGLAISSLQNPMHTFSQPGNHTVELVVQDNLGCSDTIIKIIHIDSLPVADFNFQTSATTNITSFTDLSYTSAGAITSWYWDFGDQSFSFIQNPAHTYALAGYYNVVLTVADINGCTDTVIKPVYYYPSLILGITFDTACSGNTTSFSPSISNAAAAYQLNYLWDFGDGSYATVQQPSHLYNAPGAYHVVLIAGDTYNLSDTFSINVNVYPKPSADFSNTHTCVNTEKSFVNLSSVISGNISSWDWDFGNGMTANVMTPVCKYFSKGVYHVQLIVTSDMGCKDTVVKAVEVFPLPEVKVTSDISTGCGTTFISFCGVVLDFSQNIISWEWDFDDGKASTSPYCTGHSFEHGAYDVKLTVVSDKGCRYKTSNADIIEIYPSPVANFRVSEHKVSLMNPEVKFIDLSIGASHWLWSFGDGTFSGLQSPEHEYSETGKYKANLIVENEHGCSDSTYTFIWVTAEMTFYMPSAFTPNGDGHNDVFGPVGAEYSAEGYELYIYDRYGLLVFSTRDIREKWDGRVDGLPAPAGIYAWVALVKESGGLLKKFNGHVTLIQ